MRTPTKVFAATGVALVIAGAAAAVSVATVRDDQPLEGNELDRATAAALAETGQGSVVESEIGDGGAAYEVEIRLDDGSVVELQLDERFQITGSSADDDSKGDGAGDD
jgi:hypothetical protein